MQDDVRALLERIRRCAMPGGTVECRGTWLRQRGEMRLAPGRPWVPFEAEQWLAADGIDFRWRARMRMAPLLHANVVDAFEAGRGVLTVRILGVITVARSEGPATNIGEAQRGIAELAWRPYAFRELAHVSWHAVETNRLRVAFDDGKTRAAAELDVDAEGHVLGGRADSRPRIEGKSIIDTPWGGSFREYRMYDGVRIPTLAEATWFLPDAPFTYWRAEVTEFRILG